MNQSGNVATTTTQQWSSEPYQSPRRGRSRSPSPVASPPRRREKKSAESSEYNYEEALTFDENTRVELDKREPGLARQAQKWKKSLSKYRKSDPRARLTETVEACNTTMPSHQLEYLSHCLSFAVEDDGATTPELFNLTNAAFSKARIGEATDEDEWKQNFADMATEVRLMDDFSEDDSEDWGNPVPEPARGRFRG